jgi:hypothetical protein
MPAEVRWVPVAEFGAGYEADIVEGLLRGAGIPVLVHGPEIGIFGPGFAGPTSRGVTLLVPAEQVERARSIIADHEPVEDDDREP